VVSPDDKDMARSKTGDWFKTNPQRSNANISSLVSEEKDFTEFFNYTKEFGEPAFLFSESSEYLYNPCVEIGMCPTLIKSNGVIVQQYTPQLLDPTRRSEWEALGYTYQSGWQACNLTTINCIKNNTEELFLEAVALATHLGTLQASYTSFPFLGEVTEQIVRREALLGVSMTGILTNPMFYDHDTLQKGQKIARLTNRAVASSLGINEASRICCVKPEGTASIVLGTSAGIHPYHSSHYIRRVQADRDEPLYQQVHKTHPEACEDSVYGDTNQVVIAFPCEAPPNALTRADLSAIQHLEIAKKVNIGWVRQKNDMSLQHNVSITVTVEPHEWDEVRDYIWENREYFTGIALLSSCPDYEQPPYEEVLKTGLGNEKQEKARALFDLLVSLPPLNLTYQNNNPLDNPACVSGVCDLEYNYD
jgi:ribonucleoside-diphosphate reductase alpha chain